MKSIKILNKLLIIWGAGTIIAFIITFILIFSFAKTISSRQNDVDTRYGEYQCGDNWHGHINQCSFDESFKENINDAVLIGIPIILTITVAFGIVIYYSIFTYKKRN